MKKIILAAIMLFSCVSIYSQDVVRNGNTFSNTKTSRAKEEPIATKYIWKDAKGIEYPIFVSKSSGSCFVLRISQKTGKEYRYYLGEPISREICNELGIEYKDKSNKK